MGFQHHRPDYRPQQADLRSQPEFTVRKSLGLGGKELLIIDVNPPEDFAKGHMEGAINIPFDEFEKRVQSLRKEKERNIVIVCKDGKRSMTACGIMVANKFEWVWYLKKGLEGWVAFGKTLVQ